jgi:hypothetical protein
MFAECERFLRYNAFCKLVELPRNPQWCQAHQLLACACKARASANALLVCSNEMNENRSEIGARPWAKAGTVPVTVSGQCAPTM